MLFYRKLWNAWAKIPGSIFLVYHRWPRKEWAWVADPYGLHCGNIGKLVIIRSHTWVAYICQAHASLDDWSQGYKRTKSDFRAEAYEFIYRGHELFLTTLREERPEFYHKLMSDLYNAVACVSQLWDLLPRLTILLQLKRCPLCKPYCNKLHGSTQPPAAR